MRIDQPDSDIRRARTIDPRVYHDAELYERAKERVFRSSWQFASEAAELAIPGSTKPLDLLPGCLDEPVVLIRDAGDELRAFANVCTHRGHLVVEGPGVAAGLRCRYHGRSFGLDGRCRAMPAFDDVEGFPSPADDLSRHELGRFGPLYFVALEPSTSFADWIAPVAARAGFLELDRLRLDASRSRDYLVACNWALYVENYLEGFHIPYVHPSLAGAVDLASYRTELFPQATVQVAEGRGSAVAFEPPAGHPDHGRRIAAWYVWLWPNTMLNFYPWGLSANIVRPLGPERTRVSFLCFVGDPNLLDQGAGAELDRVEREDEKVVEQVQRGIRARSYRGGRYSPSEEAGLHLFHRRLAAALSDV